jgi:type I restriction enzyme, S subunit
MVRKTQQISTKLENNITEVGKIPNDWELLKLEDVCESINDGTHFTPKYKIDGVPFYSVENVTNKNFSDVKFISKQEHDILIKRCKPEQNDILLTRIGSIGETKLIDWDINASIYVSLGLLKIDKKKIDVNYLYAYTKSNLFKNSVKKRSLTNATPQKINMGDIGKVPIPTPKQNSEQILIAKSIIDSINLEEKLSELIVKKKNIKRGTMQEFLTGKRRLSGFDGKWKIKKLEELGKPIIGLTYNPRDISSEGTLVLRSSNVFECKLKLEDNVFVNMKIPDKLRVQKGDILICVRNGSRELIGKCAQINKNFHDVAFGAFMSIFRSSFNDFIFQQFQSEEIKKQIVKNLGATINQITNKVLNSFEIYFPEDPNERNAIIQMLTDMDLEINELEDKRDKYIMIKNGMTQKLLTGEIRLV